MVFESLRYLRKIIAAEMWYYRRSLNIIFKDSRTHVSILEQLNTKGELYEKLTYFVHTSRNKSTITKYILREKIEEKKYPARLTYRPMENVRQLTNMTTEWPGEKSAGGRCKQPTSLQMMLPKSKGKNKSK